MAPVISPSLTIPIDLGSTVGSFFLGAIASVGLSGVTTLQSWLYFQKYPHDSTYLKFLVAFVWVMEILRSAISVHGGYYYAVEHWGNIFALRAPIWSMKLMIMLTNVIELVVHGFFIHKVWQTTYGRAKLLCSIIAFFALGDFAMGTGAYVTATLETDYLKILRGTPQRFATAALACAIGADWLITGALVKFFRENRTQFPRTSHLLRKLIFYAVNLGLLTSLTDVVVLVLANVSWSSLNFYQLTIFEIVGNLYANSLLACLNARDMVSEELRPKTLTPSYALSSVSGGTMTNSVSSPVLHISRTQQWASSEIELPEHSYAFKPRATQDAVTIVVQPI